jgi:amylosucrase
LALDFVFNHTADNHEWAIKAKTGDKQFMDYYLMFPDRTLPDAYEQHLREIFPEERQGSFTYIPEIERWVWTTFNSFQWDLNYANQAVFNSMAGEMLFLANIGIRFLRLDAVAFIWKQMGTMCENLPQAHWIIQAYNAILRIVAPSVLFKSEAIVHPDEVIKYIDVNECQLSYNPLLMATLWESLATRKVELLAYSMSTRFGLPDGTAWVNYVRVHDDIGWTFSDEDAGHLGINGFDHRRFLNEFYTGKFPGSFARGLPFQYNPKTQDLRISGTCASLAGLEKAIEVETEDEVELAIRRIILLYSVIMSIGGIPIIYLGDEVGTMNDYLYINDEKKADDTRWVHRIKTDWTKMEEREDPNTIAGRVFSRLRQLIEIRKNTAVLSGEEMEIIELESPHVLGYRRRYKGGCLSILVNFSEAPQTILRSQLNEREIESSYLDLVTGEKHSGDSFNLAPYQFLWLQPEK